MPIAMTRKMKPMSLVSLTALRNRMIDIAPTSENARAMLEPTIIMITVMTRLMMMRVCE